MKALPLYCLLFLFSIQSNTQTTTSNPLIGTWKETKDSLVELKVFTPTHFFFYVQNTKQDSFAYAGAGAYTISGDKSVEHLQHSNFEPQGGKAEFNYKVNGDTFYQKGVLVLGDGTRFSIHNTFLRIIDGKPYTGAHVGTWNQLSSSFTNADGTKASHTNATHIRYQIITPTNWMRISKANGKFENAFGGTYTIQGNKLIMKIDYTSVPALKGAMVDITQRIEGNRLYWKGIGKDTSGKEMIQFEDVFERVNDNAVSTAFR